MTRPVGQLLTLTVTRARRGLAWRWSVTAGPALPGDHLSDPVQRDVAAGWALSKVAAMRAGRAAVVGHTVTEEERRAQMHAP